MSTLARRARSSIQSAITDVAYASATYTYRTISIVLVVILAASSGVAFFKFEQRGDDLWLDTTSHTFKTQTLIDDFFDPPHEAELIVSLKYPGGDGESPVLQAAVAHEYAQLLDTFNEITTPSKRTYADLCEKRHSTTECYSDGLQKDVHDIHNVSSREQILSEVLELTSPSHRAHYFSTECTETNRWEDACAFRAEFPLRPSIEGTVQEIREWEKAFADRMLDLDFDYLRVDFRTTRSWEDEFARSISADIALLGIGVVLMGIFSSLTFGKRTCAENRLRLGIMETAMIVACLSTGYGLCCYAGVKITVLTQVLPFIILGIGYDDAYIILEAYDNATRRMPGAPIADRIRKAYQECALSILLTSVTDILAFLFGYLTPVPAVQWYSIYASVTVMVIFIFHITLFPAMFALTEQWRSSQAVLAHVDQMKMQKLAARRMSRANKLRVPRLHRALTYAMNNNIVKTCVLVFSFGLVVVLGATQFTRLESGFHYTEVVPDGSYVIDFADAERDNFNGAHHRVCVYSNNVATYTTAYGELTSLEWVQPPTNDTWFNDFETSGHRELKKWWDAISPADRTGYEGDLIWAADGLTLKFSRVCARHSSLPTLTEETIAWKEARALQKKLRGDYGNDDIYVHSRFYAFTEFYDSIIMIMLQSVCLCFLAILIVSSFVLQSVRNTATLMVVVACMYVCILTSMPLWGIAVSPLSIIALVMSVGIIVDYASHVIQNFGQRDPSISRNVRVVETMIDVGVPVFFGAFTTCLGGLPLVLAHTNSLRVFFRLMLTIVSSAMFYAMITLPIILSLVGDVSADTMPTAEVVQSTLEDGDSTSEDDDPEAPPLKSAFQNATCENSSAKVKFDDKKEPLGEKADCEAWFDAEKGKTGVEITRI